METDFSNWRNLQNDIDRMLDQHNNVVDIPPNSDLAEYFKTAEFNVIHRAQPNIDIKNTCAPNTEHSFYVREGPFVAGYDLNGNKYLCNFINQIFNKWQKVDLYNRVTANKKYDANELLEIGLYSTTSHGINFPPTLPNGGISTEGILEVASWGRQYIIQTFTSMWDGKNYTRSNANIEGAQWRPWVETTVTESAGEIPLLNGWEKREPLRVSRIGNQVAINFFAENGERADGTILFILPEGFRPGGQGATVPVVVSDAPITPSAYIGSGGSVAFRNIEGTTRPLWGAIVFSII